VRTVETSADLRTCRPPDQIVAKYYRSISDDNGGARTMGDRLKNIRLVSGTTQGSIKMPEAAPLIFPDIDKALVNDGVEETFKDKAQDAKQFLADYLDRRAQYKYAKDDPVSRLVVPEDQRVFKSKLADPNHPMYQGGIVTFVSGGMLAPGMDKRVRRSERRYEKDERRVLKYERRMDHGRGLSRKKQRRYDAFMAEQERRDDLLGEPDNQLGRRRSSERRGLVGSLIGAAVDAASNHGKEPAQPAPYGEQSPSNPPAPYGVSESRRHSEYSNTYDNRRSPSPYGGGNGRHRPSVDQRAISDPNNLYRGGRGQGGGPLGIVKRIMTEDVLYLMIVNLPSEAELAEAREEIERMKSK